LCIDTATKQVQGWFNGFYGGMGRGGVYLENTKIIFVLPKFLILS